MTQHVEEQLIDILESSRFLLSDINPSEWAEQNRIMTTDVSPMPGPFTYSYTPYAREIADCFSYNHPARIIAVMKGAQLGLSTAVLENVIGWIMSQNPGNILFLTGHSDLAEEAMSKKIDQMIDSSGLRPLIRASVQRAKNGRTGDTNKSKEFPGGSLIAGSASNHKLLRQRSVQYIFVDDFDAAKKSTKESGSTRKMIEQRAAAYYSKMKILYGSTPELKLTSNIEPVFLLGDQRRFKIPCPCCGEYIALFWEIDLEGSGGKEKAGIHWELEQVAFDVEKRLTGSASHRIKPGSVKYRCQKCGDSFDDSKKQSQLERGYWEPTAEPSEAGYYSYHISSLYAPPGMYDWEFYARQYLEANPPQGTRKEELHKTFINLVLGEPYEQQGAAPKANAIQQNIRTYPIGTVPEQMSIKDGNGSIIMLTCACDLNGIEQDARLDYEIVAWSETGSSYSVKHGSIGTFIPREGEKRVKADREHWTYEHKRFRSVWPELEAVLNTIWVTDTGRKMKILVSGVDCGHYTNHAYAFIDATRCNVFGLKGDKEGQYRKNNIDVPIFKPARERAKLYLLDVNYIKDRLSETMKLNWDAGTGEPQPPEFMNYPTPSAGMYLFGNFFRHYESEHRVIETKDGEGIASRWTKKSSQDPNHFWDVRVYNEGLREIWATLALRQTEQKTGNWPDFVKQVLSKK